MPTFKLGVLNIEGRKHLDRFIEQFARRNLDVILLQELYRRDVKLLEHSWSMKGFFAAQQYNCGELGKQLGGNGAFGSALFTKLSVRGVVEAYYDGNKTVPYISRWYEQGHTCRRSVIGVELDEEFAGLVVASTHFTWGSDSDMPTAAQVRAAKRLASWCGKQKQLILGGDFNLAPARNSANQAFEKAMSRAEFTPNVTTTLDPKLFRVNGFRRCVDFVWSRGERVAVEPVRVVQGMSDHCGLVTAVRFSKIGR